MIDLRDYQLAAVEGSEGKSGLAPSIAKMLATGGPGRLIVFEAPTGSGKTVMLAAALDREAKGAATLWLTPGKGKLHEQSLAALDGFLGTSALAVERLEETWLSTNSSIEPGTVLVANWEKLTTVDKETKERSNRMTRTGEARNLFDVLSATTDAGVPLIVVIDESHWGADARGTKSLLAEIDFIAPALRIEASATPTNKTDNASRYRGLHADVFVDIKDVIAAGMLVTEICVNTGLQEHLDSLSEEDRAGATGENSVLEAAWVKHGQLIRSFAAAGSPVKPLLMVQIPDSKTGLAKRTTVEAFFGGLGVNQSNGRLAIYLADEKSDNLDGISDFSSAVDVLVFKTGVATGWDCPRAQILVAFREMKSEIFAIQTIGRILRTPERKHYVDPDRELDVAYVYANIDAPTGPIIGDIEQLYDVANVTLRRRATPLTLAASYASRAGSYSDVKTALFRSCFAKAAETLGLATKLPGTPPEAKELLASDHVVTTEDILDGDDVVTSTRGGSSELCVSEQDLQAAFDSLLASRLGAYRSKSRSVPNMAQVVYDWAQQHMAGWQLGTDDEFVLAVQRVAYEYGDVLGAAVDAAVSAHQAQEIATERVATHFDWELPETLQVSSQTNGLPPDATGYAYTDSANTAWREHPSAPEQAVEKELAKMAAPRTADKPSDVLWWWKNFKGDRRFFSVEYTNFQGEPDTAYPDYVAELRPTTKGRRRIALLEAKDVNDNAPDTALKAKALAEHAIMLRAAGFDVVAGVVVPVKGGLAINDGTTYTNPAQDALTNGSTWRPLSVIFD